MPFWVERVALPSTSFTNNNLPHFLIQQSLRCNPSSFFLLCSCHFYTAIVFFFFCFSISSVFLWFILSGAKFLDFWKRKCSTFTQSFPWSPSWMNRHKFLSFLTAFGSMWGWQSLGFTGSGNSFRAVRWISITLRASNGNSWGLCSAASSC